MIIKLILDEFLDFFKFLNERNILNTGIGLVIALQVNSLFNTILDDLIKPVASKAVSEDINKHYVKIYGIHFKIGHLSMAIINFIITMILIFYLYRVAIKAPTFFETMYGGITDSISSVSKTIETIIPPSVEESVLFRFKRFK
jgi:large-conductance mechanosensitive channel